MKVLLNLCVLSAGAAALLPRLAHACSRCFGAGVVDNPTTQGIGLAMLSLLVMTGLVWGGIGVFFINMRRRAKMLEPGTFTVNEGGELVPQPE